MKKVKEIGIIVRINPYVLVRASPEFFYLNSCVNLLVCIDRINAVKNIVARYIWTSAAFFSSFGCFIGLSVSTGLFYLSENTNIRVLTVLVFCSVLVTNFLMPAYILASVLKLLLFFFKSNSLSWWKVFNIFIVVLWSLISIWHTLLISRNFLSKNSDD